MPFTLSVALRFLREGRIQTALIVGGASVGVAVMVFLTALINGVQKDLIDKTLGTQAQIVVRPQDDAARPLLKDTQKTAYLRRLQQPARRLRTISNWQRVLGDIRQLADVDAAAPLVAGAGFASRGEAIKAVTIQGIEPSSFDQVVPLVRRLIAGELLTSGANAVIGSALAEELGVSRGDKVRLGVGNEEPKAFTVRGVVDAQNKEANLRWVFVSIANAQSLLGLGGGISSIQVKAEDAFAADALADVIAARTGLVSESWMRTNQQLMTALQSQSSSSGMIQFFVVLAVALGIASVLFVSVVQRSRDIGILKAMGARTKKITRIFLVQGLLVGTAGSIIGCALGALLAVLFASAATKPDGSPQLPITLESAIFVRAAAVAIAASMLAGLAPARRAARLDPATVIRYG